MANFGSVIGTAAATAALWAFVKAASALDDKMADVQRSTGLTGAALGKMRAKIVAVSVASGKSALGLADIVYQGGKLGIANDQMDAFLSTVMKTANAFDMLEGAAAEDIGKIRDNLTLSMKATEDFMSQINFLADNVSANGAHIIEIVKRTSGTMKTLNVPTDVIAGWAAFGDQITVSPELAASGINMMMSRMMKMPGMMQKMLDDPKKAALKMLKDLSKLEDVERATKIFKVFGQEAGKFVISAVSKIDLLDKAFELSSSHEALESMNKEWEVYMKRSSTAGKRVVEIFKAVSRSIGTGFIKLFDKYSDKILKLSKSILVFVKNNPKLVQFGVILSIVTIAITAAVVAIGVITSMAAAALPVFAGIAGAFGAISLPVLAVIAVVAWLGFVFARIYSKSTAFRQSILNLASAFKPLLKAGKTIVMFLFKSFGVEFDNSSKSLEAWGEIFAAVINGLAAIIKGFFNLIIGLAKATAALSMGEGIGAAWDVLKGELGYDVTHKVVDKTKKLMPAMPLMPGPDLKTSDAMSKSFANYSKVANSPAVKPLATNSNMPQMVDKSVSNITNVINNNEQNFLGVLNNAKTVYEKDVPIDTKNLGKDVAVEKVTQSMARTNNDVRVSGEIGVRGRDGAVVEDANINLNTGSNVAFAY